MFVGDNAKIFPNDELNEQGRNFVESLHRGEFYTTVDSADNCTATSCDGIGIFWMVANSRTLPLMNYFWCRATHNGLHDDSNPAFIVGILHPECVKFNRTCTSATINKPVNATSTYPEIPYLDTTDTTNINNGSQNPILLNLSVFLLVFLCMLVCNN
jgi:hypothetical protein